MIGCQEREPLTTHPTQSLNSPPRLLAGGETCAVGEMGLGQLPSPCPCVLCLQFSPGDDYVVPVPPVATSQPGSTTLLIA